VGKLEENRKRGINRHGWQNSVTMYMKGIEWVRKWFPSI